VRYSVASLVGKYSMTSDDGETVYELIHPALKAGQPTELDFAGVEVVASPFLNNAVGRLLEDTSPADLNRLLTIMNMSAPTLHLLRKVIENAKRYYSDPAARRAQDAVIQDVEDGE
jgi:hypothetical protein